jgi:hypothetical protein
MGAMCGSPNHALLAINGYQASNLIRVPLIKMLGNLRNPQSMEAVLTQSCRIEKILGQAADGAPNHPVVMDDHFSIETDGDLGIPILGPPLYYNILQLRKVWLDNAILSSTFFEEIHNF